MPKLITTDMIKQRLYETVGDEYTLESEYTRMRDKVDFLHSKCGKIYRISPNHFFLRGSRCSCQLNAKSPEKFAEEFISLAEGKYTQLEPYTRSLSPIAVRHEECGRVYKAIPKSFLIGQRCSHCFRNDRKTTEQFSEEVDKLSEGDFSLLSEYTNNHTKVTIKHISCGMEYQVTPKDFLRGNRCPACKQSKGERLVQSILNQEGVDYIIQKSFDDLRYKNSKLPFDFFLPNHNLLIEYDGIQHFEEVKYFGGEKKLTTQRRRDELKNYYAKENKIRLLRIPYTYSPEEVEKTISSYL